MSGVKFVPFGRWPADVPRTEANRRLAMPNSGRYTQSRLLTEIDKELRRIDANAAVIEIRGTAQDLQRNGLFFSGKKPGDPGLILRFTSAESDTVVIPSDQYNTIEGNLWALYKTLEAMRGIARWGCFRGGQQYRGFVQLPSQAGGMTVRDAMHEIAVWVVPDTDDETENAAATEAAIRFMEDVPTMIPSMIRTARQKSHPDTETGAAAPGAFDRVQKAAEVLAKELGFDL